jgi:hypothetical protein
MYVFHSFFALMGVVESNMKVLEKLKKVHLRMGVEQQENMTMSRGRTIFMIHPYLLLIPIVAISSPAAFVIY